MHNSCTHTPTHSASVLNGRESTTHCWTAAAERIHVIRKELSINIITSTRIHRHCGTSMSVMQHDLCCSFQMNARRVGINIFEIFDVARFDEVNERRTLWRVLRGMPGNGMSGGKAKDADDMPKCANDECIEPGVHQCARCRGVKYCSAACQKVHWKQGSSHVEGSGCWWQRWITCGPVHHLPRQ